MTKNTLRFMGENWFFNHPVSNKNKCFTRKASLPQFPSLLDICWTTYILKFVIRIAEVARIRFDFNRKIKQRKLNSNSFCYLEQLSFFLYDSLLENEQRESSFLITHNLTVQCNLQWIGNKIQYVKWVAFCVDLFNTYSL